MQRLLLHAYCGDCTPSWRPVGRPSLVRRQELTKAALRRPHVTYGRKEHENKKRARENRNSRVATVVPCSDMSFAATAAADGLRVYGTTRNRAPLGKPQRHTSCEFKLTWVTHVRSNSWSCCPFHNVESQFFTQRNVQHLRFPTMVSVVQLILHGRPQTRALSKIYSAVSQSSWQLALTTTKFVSQCCFRQTLRRAQKRRNCVAVNSTIRRKHVLL